MAFKLIKYFVVPFPIDVILAISSISYMYLYHYAGK